MSFLTALNSLYTNVGGENDTIQECKTKIHTSYYHYYLMIPSVLMIVIMGFTLPRKTKYLQYLQGRPGAVFPMDILCKRHRFSYTAAWGSIAFLACELVLGINHVVDLEGPPYVTVFNKILSMIVIGVDYFPMFAALAVESITGYIIGTMYAWLFLSIQLFRDTECELATVTRTILILRDLPNILCLVYLSISFPYRVVQSLRYKKVQLFSASEKPSNLNLDKNIDSSPEAHHVRGLLRPDPPPPPEPVTKKEKVMAIAMRFVKDWVYDRKTHFRYSARVLSVMLMGLMVLYKITLETMVEVLSIFTLFLNGLVSGLDEIGWELQPGDDEETEQIRQYLKFTYYLLKSIRVCFIVAVVFACLGSVLTILHMLSSYRANLFDLYKGDNTHIPHRSTRTNTSLLMGSMRYSGYQVAYIVWGFVLHFLILFLVAVALCIVITLLKEGVYQWLLTLLSGAWPALVMTIIVLIVQTLLAKFAFLHEKGALLAIDNRRMFFSFTFFMFFYNIFIGFLSCLLRIIKSIVFGAIFLPRLDNSALPRRVQMFDPGFANYCGFMHVECYHTHPVMLMFIRIVMRDVKKRKEKELEDSETKPMVQEGSVVEMDKIDTKKKQYDPEPSKTYKKARMAWLLSYTLINNPSLRVYRKSHIEYMKQVQERLAKQYHINSEAAGKLVSQMNETFFENNESLTDSNLDDKFNPAQKKWHNVMGMHKFMKLLQKEIGKGDNEHTGEHSENVESTKRPGWGKSSVLPLPTIEVKEIRKSDVDV